MTCSSESLLFDLLEVIALVASCGLVAPDLPSMSPDIFDHGCVSVKCVAKRHPSSQSADSSKW